LLLRFVSAVSIPTARVHGWGSPRAVPTGCPAAGGERV